MSRVFLVGFDLQAMDDYAKRIGGYFEQAVFADRFKGIEAETVEEAVNIFYDKLKTWLRKEEQRFVKVWDDTDIDTWKETYYRSERTWDRCKGFNIFNER